jgi:glycosyltransferase involved in cell wall biosynthesis
MSAGPLSVGYVLKTFPRLSETFILREILELERLGCRVVVFSRHPPPDPVPHAMLRELRAEIVDLEPLLRERIHEAYDCHRRLALRFGSAHDDALRRAIEARSSIEIGFWLAAGPVGARASADRLDLLHAHFATGAAAVARHAARITGIPFSLTAHAKDIYSRDVDRDRLARLLLDASLAVTVSDHNVAYLRALAPAARIERVYNGVDLGLYTFLEAPPRPDPPVVLYVGRMVEKKGLMDLLEAGALVRRGGRALRLRLVGTGPLKPALRQRAAALGLEDDTMFAGPASQEEIAGTHLPSASMLVVPCLVAADGDRDGLPTTLIEAMARGVPVISTRLGGIAEAVPDGEAGLLADPGDPRSLADAIIRTLDDGGAAARARRARARVEERFDARSGARRLLALFAAAAGRAAAEVPR